MKPEPGVAEVGESRQQHGVGLGQADQEQRPGTPHGDDRARAEADRERDGDLARRQPAPVGGALRRLQQRGSTPVT